MKIKAALFFLLLALSGWVLVKPAFAQVPNSANSSYYLNTNPDVPQTLHTYTQSVFIEIASAVTCGLSGVDPTNPKNKCLGIDTKTNKIGFVDGGGGAIGVVGNLIAYTFYIPVTTHDYTSYLASNFGLAKQSYAQQGGLGFNGLLPTLKLWQSFRNITYMFAVIVFIIIGVGIMFRLKIDPRTVMSLQNQIPKVIIGLVMITFSYAIAGFLIDVMYIVLYLAISIFAAQGVDTVGVAANSPFGAIGGLGKLGGGLGGTIGVHVSLSGGMSGIASGVAQSIGGIVVSIFDGTIGKLVGTIVGAMVGKMLGGAIGGGTPLSGLIGGVLGGIGGFFGANTIVKYLAEVITYLVIIIAIFSALLRLWFVLIKSYINILIAVVFAPFYIAYGLLPGKSGFGSWIKGMVANLAVYPVTIIMLLLGKAFVNGFTNGTPGVQPFVPPMVGDFANPERFASIIGLAIILMLPEVANMARDTLKAPDNKYQVAIGKGVATGAKGLGTPPQAIFGKLMDRDRQTGKAKGVLSEYLGRNALTRAIFNTVKPGDAQSPVAANDPLPHQRLASSFRRKFFKGNNPPAAPTAPANPAPNPTPPPPDDDLDNIT